MITLRPYQIDAIAQIRQAFVEGKRAPLYVASCGSGKTTVFAAIAESSQRRGKRVLILCHRIELVDQIVNRLKQFDVTPDVIASGYGRRAGRYRASANHISVASAQTLVRRLDAYIAPTLIVCDEAHHCASGNTWSNILRAYPSAKILGVTASPIRSDSRGLASHFDKLIVGPQPRELIQQGFLAPTRVFVPPTVDTSGLHLRAGEFKAEEAEALMDSPSITGNAVSHYKKYADGQTALVFCTSVKHAQNVAEQFRNNSVAAVALHAGTDKGIRRMALEDFRQGKIKVITNVGLFEEGVDIVGVYAGIFLRPTMSLGLFIQHCGRIQRPAPGITTKVILDHVGNTQRHGLPDEPREWKLTDDVQRRKKKDAPSVRVCPKCFAASPQRSAHCIDCGHKFEVQARQEVEEKEGELVELTAEQIAKKRERQMQGRARTLEELMKVARIKGYHENWAHKVFEGRQRKA